jgi:D-sedoheptulose 7-phosphate isomerase
MSAARAPDAAAARRRAGERFFAENAQRIAVLCHHMAERFARGGRLLALGETPAARSDARHVAVEFVHPVIVGKRALPAVALTGEGGSPAEQLAAHAEQRDIVIAFGAGDQTRAAVAVARERGALTIADTPVGAEHELPAPSADPFVAQELIETAYHILWELVHVFFEHRGLLEGRRERPLHDPGAASFLYPFLSEGERDLEGVIAEVRESVLAKAQEVADLREQTLTEGADELRGAAAEMGRRLGGGGRVFALGNGGSATDAMDAVADLCFPPVGLRAHPALDLTEDPAILTAIANDVGVESVFARQLIAHARPDDAVLTFSTSGGSRNVLSALGEARRGGVLSVAFVGYDGGRIAAEQLADHVIVTRSEHVPRIQEAQASAWHVLRQLLEQAAS